MHILVVEVVSLRANIHYPSEPRLQFEELRFSHFLIGTQVVPFEVQVLNTLLHSASVDRGISSHFIYYMHCPKG